MREISDWLPPAPVGTSFTTLALCKIYGFARGSSVVGVSLPRSEFVVRAPRGAAARIGP